jgi:hypothetical protein
MKKSLIAALAYLAISSFSEKDGKKILTAEQRQSLVEGLGEDTTKKIEADLEELNTKASANPPTIKGVLASVLALFGISAFTKVEGKSVLTKEQRAQLVEQMGEENTKKIEAELKSLDLNGSSDPTETMATEMISALSKKLKTAQEEQTRMANDNTVLQNTRDANALTIEKLTSQIDIMKKLGELDPNATPVAREKGKLNPLDAKFLLGINKPFMAIDDRHPWNQRAYASLAAREGMQMIATSASFDYSSLSSDLGDYYRIRKQEALQSFLQVLPSIEKLFPLESGYQDQAVLVNLFMDDDFSQAENEQSTFANMVKGSFKFEPEIITMYGVMFAHIFTNLKALEKQWIGYLNREGSDVMKWSFIEYILVEVGKKLHNEREQRRVKGKRISPSANVLGTAMGAANGLYTFLYNQIALFKIKEFVMGSVTSSNIATILYDMALLIPAEVRDSGKLICYLPSLFTTYYHKNLETLYGENTDYTPDKMYIKEFPSIRIQSVPNADMFGRIFFTLEGNIKNFEDVPGEMYKFNLEQQDWSLKVWSSWKESIWAYMVGKKFASAAAQDYNHQLIWCNELHYDTAYYLPMTADDATPSVAQHTKLITVANAAATAITTIDDAVVGVPITIKWGNATNAPTIAKSGNFSLITAAITAPAVGDTLVVVKRSDGKFLEMSRTYYATPVAFADGDATPSVLAGGLLWATVENTNALAITNIDDAVTGVNYTIYGAGVTHPATIANSGNFVLTAAMTLGAGTFITLRKSATDGLFYEITRG